MRRAVCGTVAALYVVATIAAFMFGIWTGDERWHMTGWVLIAAGTFVVPAAVIGTMP